MGKPAYKGQVDFNSILMIVNAIVLVLTLLGLPRLGQSRYIDGGTILLAVALSIQTHVVLLLERKRRDPFVILLAFIMITFYSFRIFTLILYSFSDVFDRISFDPSQANNALFFILLANTFLYAGLFKVATDEKPIRFAGWKPTTPARAILLVLVGLLIAYTNNYWTAGEVPRVLNFLIVFVSQQWIILMALAYYLAFSKSLSRTFAVAIVGLLGIEILLHTLMGSRGAIVGLIQQVMVVLLAMNGCIKVRKKYLFAGLTLVPVVIVLVVGSFAASSFIRGTRGLGTSFDWGETIELANESLATESRKASDIEDVVLPKVFARAGFFDFSAEIIAHREPYDEVINLPSYGKSIIDNILTPGFDVFDQPRMSHALKFIYFKLGRPSKAVVSEEYHSDQLGVYGELYALFGYASIPVFFVLGYGLKRIYAGMKGATPFDLTLKRIVVLIVFGWIINSFGFDWVLLDTLVFATTIFIYRFFFRVSLSSAPSLAPRPSGS